MALLLRLMKVGFRRLSMMLPAIDVSDIEYSTTTASALCYPAGLSRRQMSIMLESKTAIWWLSAAMQFWMRPSISTGYRTDEGVVNVREEAIKTGPPTMPTRTKARRGKSLDLEDSSTVDVVHSSDPFPDVRPSSFSISLPDNSIQPVVEVVAHDSAVYTTDLTMERRRRRTTPLRLLDPRMGTAH
jgi:hypothetical protein